MRAIWTGSIGFGLVNIPVKLYSASQESHLNMDMLDRRDLSHIRYKRVNENTEKEVAWDQIVKGYLYNDEYITLEDEDFEEASPEKSQIINIKEFVEESEIDPMYYEKPYYIEPQKGGTKAYELLLKALAKTKKAGIATFILRTSESLSIVRPKDNLLVLDRLRFAEEVRSADDLNIPKNTKIDKAEIDMAVKLIDQYSKKFNIDDYHDEYTQDLLKIIKAKAGGKRPKIKKMKVTHTKSSDLLKQLKASLNADKKAS